MVWDPMRKVLSPAIVLASIVTFSTVSRLRSSITGFDHYLTICTIEVFHQLQKGSRSLLPGRHSLREYLKYHKVGVISMLSQRFHILFHIMNFIAGSEIRPTCESPNQFRYNYLHLFSRPCIPCLLYGHFHTGSDFLYRKLETYG
ncbi:hypothetical protein M501DRAFT_359623 [Patellaria atrata CBS 101060]|uniref:Uncharacterized protein n=1 Tax=Patellaria atrata CBS 101060 TaxID=1346257 RepID=A0A9P4SFU5_9PEZI|nr:hypothetical protein M501DRAFT_359623 [Patellaria atrata CBS 101060]